MVRESKHKRFTQCPRELDESNVWVLDQLMAVGTTRERVLDGWIEGGRVRVERRDIDGVVV